MPFNSEVACGIFANIGQLWLTKRFKDLDIEVEGHRFCCHRLILCACSEFFQNLLHSDIENKELVRTIVIKNIDAATFQLVLSAIYTADIGLDVDNMLRFWHAVHELEIPVLMPVCETFICSNLSRNNVFEILNAALLLQSSAVTHQCFCYLAKEFEYFRANRQQALLNFSYEALDRLVSNQSLECHPRDQLVHFILKWVDFGQTKCIVCLNNKDDHNNKISPENADNVNIKESCSSSVSNDLSPKSKQDNDSANETIAATKENIEIIFQKLPPADSQQHIESLLCGPSEDIRVRKTWLGKLLRKIELDKSSRECLEMLADNDLVMGTKECRDLVRQALETNSENHPAEVDTPVSTPNDSMEDIVAYRMTSDPTTVYALSLKSSKIYKLLNCQNVTQMYTYNNELICLQDNLGESKLVMYDSNSITSSIPAKEHCFTGSNATTVGNFMYITRGDTLYRKSLKLKTEQWTELFTIHEDWSIYCMAALENNILLYRTEPDKSGNFTVYRFNTETRHGMLVLYYKIVGGKMVSFKNGCHLYLLTDAGYCIDAIRSREINTRSKDWYIGAEHVKQMWTGNYRCLSGAIVYEDYLMLFIDVSKLTDFVNTIVPIVPNTLFLGKHLKLEHLPNAINCSLLTVPSRLLIDEL